MRFLKIFSALMVLAVFSVFSAYAEETPSWLDISGDFQSRHDTLKGEVHDYMQYDPTADFGPTSPMAGVNMFSLASGQAGYDARNDSLLTNRLRLNLKAKATENIQVKARLVMHKIWGSQKSDAVTVAGGQTGFFADRVDVFDGSVGHVPQDSVLRVDTAYATWSNIADLPVWFSIGRRPSTGGIPTHYKRNEEKVGTSGVPALLVDYAFDGLTLGVAPYVEMLPGAYAKLCYGRGNESGYNEDSGGLDDTDMLGVNVVPYDTDNLHVEVQWNRAFGIFDNMPDFGVRARLGDIDQYGAVVTGKVADLNLFASVALSKTDPNDKLVSLPFFWIDTNGNGTQDANEPTQNAGFGLMYDDNPMTSEVESESHTGTAYYLGARYDINATKIGAEYNHGSKYWITFAPAAEDTWTGKLGTRGDVYELYIIQEIPDTPISKRGKAFFKLGYQYYDFKYTGSNNWIGEPKKIADLRSNDPSGTQMFPPLEKAQDIYLTFNVTF